MKEHEPNRSPLVSIVTPVYNGERYLKECIESVLTQTYSNWEYIVNDNCSTDGTAEIVKRYAEKDPRIHYFRNERFVRAIPNHNIALGLISSESRYAKILQADDWLFPECLSRMVAIAEAHPTVGVVSAYRLDGRWVKCDGLPPTRSVIPGREIGQFSLRDGWTDLFGSMSTVMFRADLVRAYQPFFNEAHLYADTEACYRVLQGSDFGFVHQVLTFSRVHDDQLSTFSAAYDTLLLSRLAVTKNFGQHYLDPLEYETCLQRSLDRYYNCLGGHLLKGRGVKFWTYHRHALEELGMPFSWVRVCGNAAAIAMRAAIRPFTAAGRMARVVMPGRSGSA